MKPFNGQIELQRLSHEYGKDEVLRGFMTAILVHHFEELWDKNKMDIDDAETAIYGVADDYFDYDWAWKAAEDAWAEAKMIMTEYPEPEGYTADYVSRLSHV